MGRSPVGSGKVGDVRRGQLVNTDLADGQPYLVSLPCGTPLVVQKRSCVSEILSLLRQQIGLLGFPQILAAGKNIFH